MTLPQPEPRIVRVDETAGRMVRSMLYHAYMREPLYRFLFNDQKKGYSRRVRATIREEVAMYFDGDHDIIGVAVGDALAGVAFIGHPGTRLDVSNQWKWQARMMLTSGFGATRRFVNYQYEVQRHLPKGKIHLLPLIGVEPEFQQHGIGHLLMDAVHEIVAEDPDSEGIAVDTSSTHMHFFESLGYKEVGAVDIGEFHESILFRKVSPEERAAAAA